MATGLRRATVFLGLVALGFGVSVPAGTAQAYRCLDARDETADLCGRTTIRATSVRAVDVALSERAFLSVPPTGRWRFSGPPSNVRLEGGGRFAGFVLQRLGVDERAVIIGGRLDGSRGWDFFNYVGFRRGPGGIELAPGAYRITLVPSGRKLSLTIDLPNLIGAATYRASDRVASRVFTGRLPDPLGGGAGLYTFGLDDGPRFEREGVGLAAIWGTATHHVVTTAGSCFYGPGTDRTQELKYLPGCPSKKSNYLESRQTIIAAPPEDEALVHHLNLAPGLRAGRWALGSWMTAEQGLEDVKVALVWIGLN